MVVVEVAQRHPIADEEARGAVADAFVHLRQRQSNLTHAVKQSSRHRKEFRTPTLARRLRAQHRDHGRTVIAGVYSWAMAFDEGLAERIRAAVSNDPLISERKMFGGLAFLHQGNMACGIVGDELMVRVGPDAWDDSLRLPHAREMDFTGRSMRGMVYVGVEGFAEDDDLDGWVERGLCFARTFPPK